jgi:dTDP-glucose pyrophosphorylase
MKLIIPAAGYGTRMGMTASQSKELVPVESEHGRVIDWILKQTKNALVIIRPDKKSLKNYLSHKYRVDLMEIQNSSEWTDTVYRSRLAWDDRNCLVLPDTRYAPTSIIHDINKALHDHDIVFATHEVQDPHKWGVIAGDLLYEKPTNNQAPARAWGLIGFTKKAGTELFKDLNERKVFNLSKYRVKFIPLESFKDITRGEDAPTN